MTEYGDLSMPEVIGRLLSVVLQLFMIPVPGTNFQLFHLVLFVTVFKILIFMFRRWVEAGSDRGGGMIRRKGGDEE
jgi:hypothetical protein